MTELSATAPLFARLPPIGTKVESGDLLDRFLDYVKFKGVDLYPAQEEAILALYEGQNVILNTPTGSGKSLVATALHFSSLARGRRSVYTCPIKALVNEKFLALCHDFGADQVGMVTGDATVNRDAPILCCTAEILSNMALGEGEQARVHDVVMDEFHYYSDKDRGVAWQVPLLTLKQSRFLLMSATFGETELFEKTMTGLNGLATMLVRSSDRPVPLDFVYQETPLHETIRELIARGKAPIYLVSFSQREAAEEAQNLLSVDFCTKEEKKAINEALSGVRFTSPYGKEIQKLLKHGLGLHHAGLLPKYRVLVERMAQQGLLKIISGTDTLGVGVNIPIRTVLLTKLCKFDGEKSTILSVRDFHQISGRAGRKGFDNLGSVVVQAPAHVVENLQLEAKAGGDSKKLRKIVRRKPPERGYVHWDVQTFKRLTSSPPEPLLSRFAVTHGMLLNTLSRTGDGCRAMRRLIADSHETPEKKRQHSKIAFQLFRSLVERGIVQFVPLAERESSRARKLRVNIDLQDDFSLNQSLSLYLLDTLKLLDPYSETFALDLLTLVESILENPEMILRQQLSRLKGEKMAEMKMQGMEFDERMAELEKLEYPKPNRDFIYDTFNQFAAAHPWVGQDNIRPKSVAREMFENFHTFEEYVREYDLQRVEGVLLRYISDVYKVLVQTVPESYRQGEVSEMIAYFGALVRQIDSSLLDEWERMRKPLSAADQAAKEAAQDLVLKADITRDVKGFAVLLRNELFRVVKALARHRYSEVLAVVEPTRPAGGAKWLPAEIETELKPYFEEHQAIDTGRASRHPQTLKVELEDGGKFAVAEQTLLDEAGPTAWRIRAIVDYERSREIGKPSLFLENIAPF